MLKFNITQEDLNEGFVGTKYCPRCHRRLVYLNNVAYCNTKDCR